MKKRNVLVLVAILATVISSSIIIVQSEESDAVQLGHIALSTSNEGVAVDLNLGYVPTGLTFNTKGQWPQWANYYVGLGDIIHVTGTPDNVGLYSFTFSYGPEDNLTRSYVLEVLYRATFHNANGSTTDQFFSVYSSEAMPGGTTSQFCGWNTAADGSGVSYLQGTPRPQLVRHFYEQSSSASITVALNYTSIGNSTNNITSVKVIPGQEVMLPVTQRTGGIVTAYNAQCAWYDSARSLEIPITDTAVFTEATSLQERDAARKTGYTFVQTNYTGYFVPTGTQFTLKIQSCEKISFALCNNRSVHDGSILTAVGERMNITRATPNSSMGLVTISYNPAGGTGTMPSQAVYIQSTIIYPTQVDACTFVPPPGKIFNGWRLGSATGPPYTPGNAISLEQPTVLYATWVDPPIWTISYNPGSGTGSMPSETVIRGETFTFPDSTYSAPNQKSFSHWSVAGSNEIYHSGDVFIPTSDTVITAVWKWDYFFVNLMPNGAPGDISSIQISADNSSYILPGNPFPTWEDHEFLGWKPANSGPILSVGYAYTLTDNINLFGQWLDLTAPIDKDEDPDDSSFKMENWMWIVLVILILLIIIGIWRAASE
jgi:Listeria-Bacteroides repeat domain (List_Bact_rpt).